MINRKEPEAVPSGAHSWPTEKTTQKPYIPNNLEKHRKSPGSPKISGVLYGTLQQNRYFVFFVFEVDFSFINQKSRG